MKFPYNIFSVFHWSTAHTLNPIHIGFLPCNPFYIGLWRANNGQVLGQHIQPQHILTSQHTHYKPNTVYRIIPMKHYPTAKKLK